MWFRVGIMCFNAVVWKLKKCFLMTVIVFEE